MVSLTVFVLSILIPTPGALAAQTAQSAHTASPASSEVNRTQVTIEAAAGTTLDGGTVVSTSVGVRARSWLTLLAEGEAFHLPTRHSVFATSDGYYGVSDERGFTTYMFGGEMRIGVPVNRRVTPFGAVGIGAGRWESNVE